MKEGGSSLWSDGSGSTGGSSISSSSSSSDGGCRSGLLLSTSLIRVFGDMTEVIPEKRM